MMAEVTAVQHSLLEGEEAPVTLYSVAGRAVSVPGSDVEYWLGQGLSRERCDAAALATEVDLLLESARGAIRAYVAETLRDGHIHREADRCCAVAERAVAAFAERWLLLHQGLRTRYAVLEEGAEG